MPDKRQPARLAGSSFRFTTVCLLVIKNTHRLHQRLHDFKGSALEGGVVGRHIRRRRFRQEQLTSFLVLFLLLLLLPRCVFPVIAICSRENTAVKRLSILTSTLFKLTASDSNLPRHPPPSLLSPASRAVWSLWARHQHPRLCLQHLHQRQQETVK